MDQTINSSNKNRTESQLRRNTFDPGRTLRKSKTMREEKLVEKESFSPDSPLESFLLNPDEEVAPNYSLND